MLRNDLAHGVVNDTLAAASPIVHCLKPHTQGYVYLSTGSGTWCAEIMVVGCVGWEGVEKKQVPPPEGPLSMRQESFESGRPWFAIPPGKGNGREHQDLRRRHLLVRDRKRPPHFDTLRAQAVMRAFGEPSSVSSIQPSPFSTALPSAESEAILTITTMHPRLGPACVGRRGTRCHPGWAQGCLD
jgi:hypothetical protein